MDIETIVEDKMPKTGINLYWFTAIAVLVVWPFFFFVAIEGFRGSSLSIFKSSAHAYGYQLAILLILFAPFAPLSIAISRTKERRWILIGIAILLLVYHVMGALFNFWVSGCYGFGRGCI